MPIPPGFIRNRRSPGRLTIGLVVLMSGLRIAHGDPGPAADKGEVAAMCQKISAKLNSVPLQECLESRLTRSDGRSHQEQPILLREYPPTAGRAPQARILLLGGIHGDEYSSISIVFKWMKILEQHHTGRFHWLVAPLVNPDGLLQPHSTRTNSRGVDLNRNFQTANWTNESREYWEKHTGRDPRRYPGDAPLSEPEARWIHQEIERFRPNAIVQVHAPYNLLDFDGPPSSPPKRLGPLFLSLLGTFPGSLGRYAGIQLAIPVLTIELPNAGVMPAKHDIAGIWTDLVGWLGHNVRDGASTLTAQAGATRADEPDSKPDRIAEALPTGGTGHHAPPTPNPMPRRP